MDPDGTIFVYSHFRHHLLRRRLSLRPRGGGLRLRRRGGGLRLPVEGRSGTRVPRSRVGGWSQDVQYIYSTVPNKNASFIKQFPILLWKACWTQLSGGRGTQYLEVRNVFLGMTWYHDISAGIPFAS